MLCEICGQREAQFRSLVEGIQLAVCSSCSSFGSAPAPLRRAVPVPPVARVRVVPAEPEESIVAGFGARIKAARERRGMSQDQLAAAVREKSSLIHKFETEHAEPPLGVARKIEQYLGVRLVETVRQDAARSPSSSAASLTIGDTIRIRKR